MDSSRDRTEPQTNAVGGQNGTCGGVRSKGRVFEIRVKGYLDSRWADWLEGMEVVILENGEMMLSGEIVDQAALMGLLNRLYRLNLPLLSVNEVRPGNRCKGTERYEVQEMGNVKDATMDNARKLDGNFVTAAWAAFFIWWGILELFEFLPKGTASLGFGVILLGLNVARSLNGIPTSGFTTTIGLLALVLGGLELTSTILLLPFDLPIFAILLITLGVIMLVNELWKYGSR